ncbi:MAG: hypothetical protein ACR2JC_05860 [Chloroflexota bacterium]
MSEWGKRMIVERKEYATLDRKQYFDGVPRRLEMAPHVRVARWITGFSGRLPCRAAGVYLERTLIASRTVFNPIA